jgi:hypothetical protein
VTKPASPNPYVPASRQSKTWAINESVRGSALNRPLMNCLSGVAMPASRKCSQARSAESVTGELQSQKPAEGRRLVDARLDFEK